MKKLFFSAMLFVATLEAFASTDRVNLWPIFASDNGQVEVIAPLFRFGEGEQRFLWPLGAYRNSSDWRFFPIMKERNGFGIFPELWIWDDEFAVLPLYCRYDLSEGILFPIVWWNTRRSHQWNSIFPLYYYGWNGEEDMTFWAGFGLGGYAKRNGRMRAHWLLPFYCVWDNGDFFSIPYSRSRNCEGIDEAYLFGLAGRTIATDEVATAHWAFPLYGKNEKGFYSLPYIEEWYGDRTEWFSPLTFSGGSYSSDESESAVLLGILGHKRIQDKSRIWLFPICYSASNEKGITASAIFPLYYWDDRGTFVTALYGHNKESQWCFPIWYRDEKKTLITPLAGWRDDGSWLFPLYAHSGDQFFSLAYMRHHDTKLRAMCTTLPFLLSEYKRFDDGRGKLIAMLIYGHESDKKGEASLDYLFPFYRWDRDGFHSLVYGHENGGSSYYLTPIVGTYGGKRCGGWLFPLFNYRADDDYDEVAKLMDLEELPESASVSDVITSVNGSFLVVSDFDRTLRVVSDESAAQYKFVETRKRGNRLLYNRDSTRTVVFNAVSGCKISDDTRSDSSFLWRVWHRTERNGEITIDAFPGYTYDKKANGYEKTSFLWRFYRNEYDPQKGREIDILFIPVCR